MTAPLRTRLVLALVAVVLLSVGSATWVHLRAVSSQLERRIDERAARALESLQTELLQHESRLERVLDELASDRRQMAQLAPERTAVERYGQAAARLRPGVVDVLEVIAEDGTTLSSGHWPTRIDLRQAPFPADATAYVARVPTPSAPEPRAALVLVRPATAGTSNVQLVAGRWLGLDALAATRERLGVDRLAICDDAGCVQAGSDAGRLRERTQALRGAGAPHMIVGVDRGDLDALRGDLRTQALLVALLSALLALGVGLALSRGIVRPVEALAEAAGRMSAGDLATRVPPGSSRVREVEDLVGAFNAMGGELQTSQEQLVQAERVAAWREIARGLAHELKNPLTPIRGAMDVIRRARSLDREDFDEILHEQADAVLSEVARLKELSDSFARFARLPDPQPEDLDPGAVLEDAAALYAHGLEVHRQLEPATVYADRNQLATVFTNLVKNASEAMEGAGILRLVVRAEGDEVEIRVEDDGPGIAPAVRERLFTPYVTTKGSRGTGLGLAMAHRIVLEHRGRIEVTDAEGGGAVFVIRLPAASPR